MKIICIKVHPPFSVCDEQEWCARQYRERWMIRQLKELGHSSSLFLLTDKKEVWQTPDVVPVKFFPVDNPSVAKQEHTSIVMLQELERERPDVIIYKGLDYKLSKWVRENLSYRPQIVFIVGGKVNDKYLSEASFILAETIEQANTFFKHFIDNKRCWILPKSLDVDIFKPNNNKEFDIVSVGTFEERKNHKLIIPLGKKYSIILLGDGHLKPKIIQMAKDLDVLHNVHFMGNQPTEKVAEYISKSKILYHPSSWEGFPRCVIESLACGVPVVANKNVIKDLIVSGKHGLLVEENEFEKAIDTLLSFPELRNEMGNNGIELAKKYDKYSTIPILKEMLKILEVNK